MINEKKMMDKVDGTDKKLIVLIGNYGSGKTELAINFALKAAREGEKTALVDMDIVNPYFRSAEKRVLLEEAGVRLIASPYANTAVDLPIVPPEFPSVFDGDESSVVIDVGGDSVGALALGQFRQQFANCGDALKTYFVLNARRPLSNSVDRILPLFSQVQASARIPINGLINNSNLAAETVECDILEGQALLKIVAQELNLPIAYTCGYAELLEKAAKQERLEGIIFPINTYMRPEWL